MKIKIEVTEEREIDVSFVGISVHVRYDEEQIPNDFPLRKNDMWNATIEANTGRILNWPEHPACQLHLKVVDEGKYHLLDSVGEKIATLEDAYVPHGVIPGEYGDYIILDISEKGIITNWPAQIDVKAFFP